MPENIQPIATQYLHGVSFGFPALAVYAVLRSYCEALGRPEPVTVISIIGLLADIPLNYIFIHGLFGMPEMGGAGCGVATAIVLWINVLLLAAYTSFTKRQQFASTRFFYAFASLTVHRLKSSLNLVFRLVSLSFLKPVCSAWALLLSVH